MTYNIIQRHKILINHDPQKRCYNGAYFDAKLKWSSWEVLESNISEHTIDSRINFWSVDTLYRIKPDPLVAYVNVYKDTAGKGYLGRKTYSNESYAKCSGRESLNYIKTIEIKTEI